MNSNNFSFSDLAQKFAINLDLINEVKNSNSEALISLYNDNQNSIQEVRNQVYNELSFFGETLVSRLKERTLPTGLKLWYKKTTTGGQYGGGNIHYFSLIPQTKEQIDVKLGEFPTLGFVFPNANNIDKCDDGIWGDYWKIFDVINRKKMLVFIGSEGSSAATKERYLKIAQNPIYGEYVGAENWQQSLMVNISGESIIQSALEKLDAILMDISSESAKSYG